MTINDRGHGAILYTHPELKQFAIPWRGTNARLPALLFGVNTEIQ
jgi:hypothetical protein